MKINTLQSHTSYACMYAERFVAIDQQLRQLYIKAEEYFC